MSIESIVEEVSLVLTEDAFNVWMRAGYEVRYGHTITFEEKTLFRAEHVVNDALAIRLVVYGYRLNPDAAFGEGNASVVGSFELVDRQKTGFSDYVSGADILDVYDVDDEIPTHVCLSYMRSYAGELIPVTIEVEVGIGGSVVAAESDTVCKVY